MILQPEAFVHVTIESDLVRVYDISRSLVELMCLCLCARL